MGKSFRETYYVYEENVFDKKKTVNKKTTIKDTQKNRKMKEEIRNRNIESNRDEDADL